VHAYSFNWTGSPYIADYWGNYSYRDLTAEWTAWSGIQTFTYNPVSYTYVASCSYDIDSYASLIDAQYFDSGGEFDGQAWDVNCSNPPQYVVGDSGHYGWGDHDIFFAVCDTQNCASVLSMSFGSMLAAYFYEGGTVAYCAYKHSPYANGC
jgi:hypothetical protein